MWNVEAAHERETAKIAVWWDMMDCQIPVGYDARRVRPSIEGEFRKLGYSGTVSITAYGDQTQTPDHLLLGLSSTGVSLAHVIDESRCALMYSDMVKWRHRNPPPATIMFISDQMEDGFYVDLARLQQVRPYNIFLAFSFPSVTFPVLHFSKRWVWDELLGSSALNNNTQEEIMISSAAMFYCKSCNFDCQSLRKFRNHLSSIKHASQERTLLFSLQKVRYPTKQKITPVTSEWGRNYPAKPKYATANIMVRWDMGDCPIPVGFDPTRVRPSLEGAFKTLGYSGPVSITAYGDQSQTPDHLLRGLSSTGVSLVHVIDDELHSRLFSDWQEWKNLNPPPATLMIISNNVDVISAELASHQQMSLYNVRKYNVSEYNESKYNVFLAYSFRPYKMLPVVTSAEWLWESLVPVPETRRHVLQRCTSQRGESTGMSFDCKTCSCDCKSLDDFMKHLSTNEHAWKESCIHERFQSNERMRMRRKRKEQLEDFPKSKRLRITFRTGFRPFHNHSHLTRNLMSDYWYLWNLKRSGPQKILIP